MNNQSAKRASPAHSAPPADFASQSSTLAAELPSVPDHELLRHIGGGSYGEVWMARNAVGTLRAVKIVHRQTFERDEHFEREFKGIQTFEPISRSHEGLVDILQIGRNAQAGYFYYVMELADSVLSNPCSVNSEAVKTEPRPAPAPLITDSQTTDYSPRTLRSDLKHRGSLSPDQCITIGLKLASALEHLHARGLVHRDIKPSNIIFVAGEPKLADIGLVTAIDEANSLVGTVGYIAPEGPGTPQADLYSLGKVLYEISLGKDRQDFPQLPPDLPKHPDYAALLELNEVTLKACETDPGRRYQSAQQLYADLALCQRGGSVKRRRAHEHLMLLAKRALVVTAIFVLFAAAVWMLSQKLPRAEIATPSVAMASRLASRRQSTNAKANMLVEQGFSIMKSDTPERLSRALSCFTNAIRLDPRFARAHAGLFEVYINDASAHLGDEPVDQMERLRSIARKLLELDDTLPESHYAHSYVQFSSWKFDGALESVRHALQLDPNYAQAHFGLAFYLTHLGWLEEGRREYAHSLELQPTNPRFVRHQGHPFYMQRQFDQAQAQYQAALDLEPRHTLTHYWLGRCYQAKKEFLKAIDEYETYDLGGGAAPEKTKARFDELRAAYRERGERGYWLKQRELAHNDESTSPYEMARIVSHLGPADEMFAWLDKAYEKRDRETLEYLLFDECWDPYRNDPRFQDLLRRVGFTK